MTAAATAASNEAQPAQLPVISRSTGLVARIANRFSVDPDKLMTTLKLTAFRQRADDRGNVREPTNEEMMALLILADNYKLNPFTKELFAYFDTKSKAIIPVVSVDGWIRIINEQPTLRSLSFAYSPETVKHKNKTCHEWMEIEIVRSDRDKPIVIREYFAEVVREVSFATPWDTHPNRMHRHKTLIQGARVAFGFGGIYDEDEAARIIDGEAHRVPESRAPAIDAINAAVTGQGAPALEHNPGETVPPVTAEGEKVAVDTKAAVAETKAAATETTKPKAETASKAPVFADVGALIARAVKEKKLSLLDDAAGLAAGLTNDQHKREASFQIAEARRDMSKDDGK